MSFGNNPGGSIMKSYSIGILVFDCVDEMDVVGPWEVLTAWRYITAKHPKGQPVCGKEAAAGSPVDVFTFALPEQSSPIRCAKGLRLVPDFVWGSPDMPDLDVLIYPGGPDMSPHFDRSDPRFNPGYRKLVESLDRADKLMVSVCVGALAFAHFGLLHNLPATTHWLAIEALQEADPTLQPQAKRFVDTGRVVSSAGISASIDLALHLVERLDSTARAREVRRYLEYDPAPPASILGNPGNPGWAVGSDETKPARSAKSAKAAKARSRIAHPAHLFHR
jgi:transcriptional regulator GlxA family with amidase domain